jgi:hypothetical protein
MPNTPYSARIHTLSHPYYYSIYYYIAYHTIPYQQQHRQRRSHTYCRRIALSTQPVYPHTKLRHSALASTHAYTHACAHSFLSSLPLCMCCPFPSLSHPSVSCRPPFICPPRSSPACLQHIVLQQTEVPRLWTRPDTEHHARTARLGRLRHRRRCERCKCCLAAWCLCSVLGT